MKLLKFTALCRDLQTPAYTCFWRLRRFQNQVVTQTISRFIRRFIQILGMRVRGRQEQSDRIQTRYKPVIACGDGALRGRLENTLNYQKPEGGVYENFDGGDRPAFAFRSCAVRLLIVYCRFYAGRIVYRINHHIRRWARHQRLLDCNSKRGQSTAL